MGRTVYELPNLLRALGQPEWPIIVDVRPREAYDRADTVLPTAVWRDHRRAAEWGPTLPRSQPVLVYCVHGGPASQTSATLLREIGANAAFLPGGISAWVEADGPTVGKASLARFVADRPSRWVTRERPKIDRIACPWLIRRFIDRDARFHYVAAEWVKPIAEDIGGLAFDVPDTAFSHDAEQCSFDAFIRLFSIADPILGRLAAIVRGADTGRLGLAPQCAGLLAISLGLSATCPDDEVMLERGSAIYDALYGWLRLAGDETHTWTPPA